MPPLSDFTKHCVSLSVCPVLLATAQAATITVNTTVDVNGAGPCTLREAVQSLQSADTGSTGCTVEAGTLYGINDKIQFVSGLSGQTISVTLGPITLTRDITINGSLEERVTIKQEGSDRLFRIGSGNINFDDLRLTGTAPNLGGGIFIGGGSLSLKNSEISSNAAFKGAAINIIGATGIRVLLIDSIITQNTSTSSGGAIYMDYNNYLELKSSELSDNFSSTSGGGIAAMGNGRVRIVDSTITGNTAMNSGGGLSFSGSSRLILVRSDLSNNLATGPGGGVSATGSARISLQDSVISRNGANAGGGAISLEGGTVMPTLTTQYSTIVDNFAGAGSNGGGILAFNASLRFTNSTVSGNYSAQSGGGIRASRSQIFLVHSTVSGNTAGNSGGGIFTRSSTSTSLINTIIAGNDSGTTGAEVQGSSSSSFSGSGNLFGDASHTTAEAFNLFPATTGVRATSNGNLPTALPQILKPLSAINNGTPTHPLSLNSPAIDNASQALCSSLDQSYLPRNDGQCDIGSSEYVEGNCFVVKASNGSVITFCL